MDVLTNLWAAISAAFVGVDRAAFSVAAFKEHTSQINYGKRKNLLQIIIMGFFIYVFATALNMFFAADFSLNALALSFGATVLLYVSGNKVIMASGEFGQDDDPMYEQIRDAIKGQKGGKTLALASKNDQTGKYTIFLEVTPAEPKVTAPIVAKK
jgi:hypothetical protein